MWEGPRRLVHISPKFTDGSVVQHVLRRLRLYAGIPYAWEGKHAGWLEDAATRGFRCSTELLAAGNPTIVS